MPYKEEEDRRSVAKEEERRIMLKGKIFICSRKKFFLKAKLPLELSTKIRKVSTERAQALPFQESVN